MNNTREACDKVVDDGARDAISYGISHTEFASRAAIRLGLSDADRRGLAEMFLKATQPTPGAYPSSFARAMGGTVNDPGTNGAKIQKIHQRLDKVEARNYSNDHLAGKVDAIGKAISALAILEAKHAAEDTQTFHELGTLTHQRFCAVEQRQQELLMSVQGLGKALMGIVADKQEAQGRAIRPIRRKTKKG